MIETIHEFSEFGVLAAFLVLLLFGIGWLIVWLCRNVAKPMVTASISFMEKHVEAFQGSVDQQEKITLLQMEIRDSIATIEEIHTDKNSHLSTFHTNQAISTLAKMVRKMAECVDCEVFELLAELDKTLEKQVT